MSYHIFLDDIRDPDWVTWVRLPTTSWMVVRSYAEFVKMVETAGVPVFVSFDHDLAAEHYTPETKESDYIEKTGADCARWLVNRCLDEGVTIPDWAVHSMNPSGRDNIESIMDSGRRVQEAN